MEWNPHIFYKANYATVLLHRYYFHLYRSKHYSNNYQPICFHIVKKYPLSFKTLARETAHWSSIPVMYLIKILLLNVWQHTAFTSYCSYLKWNLKLNLLLQMLDKQVTGLNLFWAQTLLVRTNQILGKNIILPIKLWGPVSGQMYTSHKIHGL